MNDQKKKYCLECGEEQSYEDYHRLDGYKETYCRKCRKRKGVDRRALKKERFKFKY